MHCNDVRGGALALSGVLKHCTKLNLLDISACLLGSVEVLAVAEGLRHCSKLLKHIE